MVSSNFPQNNPPIMQVGLGNRVSHDIRKTRGCASFFYSKWDEFPLIDEKNNMFFFLVKACV